MAGQEYGRGLLGGGRIGYGRVGVGGRGWVKWYGVWWGGMG